MEKVNLSSPWVTFIHEIQMLFGQDPDISIVVDNGDSEVKLYVDNLQKADALTKLLPDHKDFGGVTLKITVIPSNIATDDSPVAIIRKAFDGNPVLSFATTIDAKIGSFSYAVFKNEVVQFFNDQLDDLHGNKSMLYQDIAKDVLGNVGGVFYCTDVAD